MATPILFATESYPSRSPMVSSERLVNMFAERQPPGAKSQAPLFGAPGLDVFSASSGTDPARGAWLFQGTTPYFVIGQNLYSYDVNGNATLCGSGITGTGRVSMADNGKQIIIVNGGGSSGSGWVWNVQTATFSQITASAFYPADSVIFMDGYFILNRSGTNEFFLSALYDGTSYNGLDFASAEARSGLLVAIQQNIQLLFLLTNDHFELWYDSGALEFPFQRYSGGEAYYGCMAAQTVCLQDGAIFMLGADKTFYRLQANVPIRISSHALETVLNADADLTQAFVFTYTWEGHKFIVLTLPMSMQTWVFDVSTAKWHQRESWMGASAASSVGLWRVNCVAEAYQRIVGGDLFGSQIGELDAETFTEYGNPIPATIISPTQQKDRLRLFLSLLELDVQGGAGLASGNIQDTDPQWMMAVSFDGGQTWGDQQLWSSIGKIGTFDTRVRWAGQMGSGRQITFKLTCMADVQKCVLGAFAKISLGLPY